MRKKNLVWRAVAVALALAPIVVAGAVNVNPDSIINPFGRSWSAPSTQPGASLEGGR